MPAVQPGATYSVSTAVQPGATYSVSTDDAFLLGILLYDGLFGKKNRWNFQN